jgi:hypothetical protein
MKMQLGDHHGAAHHRAKAKIKAARIPYRMPSADVWPSCSSSSTRAAGRRSGRLLTLMLLIEACRNTPRSWRAANWSRSTVVRRAARPQQTFVRVALALTTVWFALQLAPRNTTTSAPHDYIGQAPVAGGHVLAAAIVIPGLTWAIRRAPRHL